MALPNRTEAQRAADLAAATAARHDRALLREQLKSGDISLSEVLDRKDDDIVGRMKVATLLESLPGYGKSKAKQAMDELGISPSRRVQGLGQRQLAAIRERFLDD